MSSHFVRVRRTIRQTVVATAIGAGLGAAAVIAVVAAAVTVLENKPIDNRKVEAGSKAMQPAAAASAAAVAPSSTREDTAAPEQENACDQQIWPYYDAACLTRIGRAGGEPAAMPGKTTPVPYVSAHDDVLAAPKQVPIGPVVAPMGNATLAATGATEGTSEPTAVAAPETSPTDILDPPPKPKKKAARHGRHERRATRRTLEAQKSEPNAAESEPLRSRSNRGFAQRGDGDEEEFSARESYAPEAREDRSQRHPSSSPDARKRQEADRASFRKRKSAARLDEEQIAPDANRRGWESNRSYDSGGGFFGDPWRRD